MRTLIYIFAVRNAIKRKQGLFSLKRSASCAMTKNNNWLKRFAASARVEVAQLAFQIMECPPLLTAIKSLYMYLFRGLCSC